LRQPAILELLWADDDSRGAVAPLVRRLRERGFRVSVATSYAEALTLLSEGAFNALLVDIILPRADDTVGLGSYQGLELARDAAELNIENIAFLTVVQPSEVAAEYRRLEADYPGVKFSFHDKMLLLDPKNIDVLANSLRR